MNARTPRLYHGVLGLALVLLTMAGCQAFQAYRPAPILAIDAETKQPIPGADVRISYPMSQPEYAPREVVGSTGPDGIARVEAAPYGDGGIAIGVSAKGYLGADKFLTTKEVQAIERSHFFEDVGKRPPVVVVEVLAGPRPSVELLIPANFRGRIKATVDIRSELPLPPGQRCFSFPVSATGDVTVVGPTLLRSVQRFDFKARTPEGILPDRPTDIFTVGFWWLKSELNTHIYMVGTRSEFDTERRAIQAEEMRSAPPRPAGNGGGQGKRGRRG